MIRFAGFVDANFLRVGGSLTLGLSRDAVELNAPGVVGWLKQAAIFNGLNENGELLRVYWYDGQWDPSDPRHNVRKPRFDEIGLTAGVQLRLGHLTDEFPEWEPTLQKALDKIGVTGPDRTRFFQLFPVRMRLKQKGVDTLIVLDMVRLAQRHAYDVAVLIGGDRDLAEAVRATQDEGRRVVVAHPRKQGIAHELQLLADEVWPIDEDDLRTMVYEPEHPANTIRRDRQGPGRALP